ncbi:ECF transporter S component [Pumilibacter muris]|uniref:ECF transporter S component n=1 Tax=Pumilibacter muris TaxID=2941510 RepID=UPI00203AF919|nr:ECF transporter S component [Pumilibacter muris]
MREKFFTTRNITVAAVMTAISFVLYMFAKFPLPMFFPPFLDIQFSEMPAMLTGFMMGPIWGSLIIVFKCLLKLPFTSTAGVGELGDLLMGIAYVLPASLIYKRNRTKSGALIALAVGTACQIVIALVVNGVMLIPFYAKAYGWEAVVGMLTNLFPNISKSSFYRFYLPLSVLPFNLLRLSVCSVVTFFVYKHLHKLINRMFAPRTKRNDSNAQTASEELAASVEHNSVAADCDSNIQAATEALAASAASVSVSDSLHKED